MKFVRALSIATVMVAVVFGVLQLAVTPAQAHDCQESFNACAEQNGIFACLDDYWYCCENCHPGQGTCPPAA